MRKERQSWNMPVNGPGSIDIEQLAKGPRDRQFDLVMKSAHSQVVLAALAPGHSSTRRSAVNRDSDQIVYAVEGEGMVKVGSDEHPIHAGCLFMIPAGSPHQLINTGARRLLYLDFYAPPAY